MSDLSLQLLGNVIVLYDGQTRTKFRTTKAQALLAYLAVENDAPHPREQILDLLWPGLPLKSARTNLRQVMYQLRIMFPELSAESTATNKTLFESNRQAIQLNSQATISIDAVAFEAHLRTVHQHLHSDIIACESCVEELEAAVDLYKGVFLENVHLADSNTFEDWLLLKRESLRRQCLDALEQLTKIYLAHQRFADAEAVARRQLTIDEFREGAHRQLLEALARNGQRNEAMVHYSQLQQLLQTELGMTPSHKTIALIEAVATDDLDLAFVRTMPVRGYELLEQLGQGAFGVVHRAYQPSVGREVVVKIIRSEFANRPDFIRRFEYEMQTVARLEHPHIVPLYDFWREPNRAYLVMRYLRGGTLHEKLEAKALSIKQVSTIVEQVAFALHAAHKQGLIHRDVNPNNVLLDEEGNAYLSDFGIAMEAGSLVPTPASLSYLSPEQQRNELPTVRTDIYGLGVTLGKAITGLQLPINGQVGAVIARATANNPNARFENMLAFADATRQAIMSINGMPSDSMPQPILETENPYKGLQAFQENDSRLFFGRNQLINQLVTKLADSRFLAVVGPSGSGKSSVVKAGLIPKLRNGTIEGSQEWFMTEMVPSSHPLEELEAALLRVAVDPPTSLIEPLQKDERGLIRVLKRILPLRSDGMPAQLLLVIDQFEELFTLVADKRQRRHFVDNLLAALNAPRSQLRLVITLRADFYDQPLQMPGLAELLQASSEAVVPLNSAEIEQAITQPARLAGTRFATGLANIISDDVLGEAGMLPLLQFALTELFEHRGDGIIPLNAYAETGGVLGVLGKRAEEIFAALSAEDKLLAKQLFLRLVTLGEGSEDTRRRVLQAELASLGNEGKRSTENSQQSRSSAAPSSLILSTFAEARLLSFDRDLATRSPTVEVAHEALLREWPRFRDWLSESRDDLRLQRRLGVLSAEYTQSNADPSFLLRGGQLHQFEGLATQDTISLTVVEQTFLQASIDARAKQHADDLAQRQREQEQMKKLALAYEEAETERHRAEKQAKLAFARELAAHATKAVQHNAELCLLLALKSLDLIYTPDAETALHIGLQNFRVRQMISTTADGHVNSDSRFVVVTNCVDSTVYEAFAWAELYTLTRFPLVFNDQYHVVFENTINQEDNLKCHALDVERVQSAYTNYTREFASKSHNGYQRAMDQCLTLYAFGDSANGEVWLIDSVTNKEIARWQAHESSLAGLQMSADGTLLVSADFNNQVKLWNIAMMRDSRRPTKLADFQIFDGTNSGTVFMTISPSKQKLAIGGEGLEIRDLSAPNVPAARFTDASNLVFGPLFNGDETLVAGGGPDGAVYLIDALTGESTIELDGHRDTCLPVAFSADGTELITSSSDGTVLVWDIRQLNNTELTVFPEVYALFDLKLSPDGTRLGVGAGIGRSGRAAYILDRYTGKVLHTFVGDGRGMYRIAFSPDGAHLATVSEDNLIRTWDLETGKKRLEFVGHESALLAGFFPGTMAVDYAPDGRSFVTGSSDRLIKRWDAVTGELIQTYEGYPTGVNQAFFSPDGTLLISSGEAGADGEGKLWVWNVETGEHLRELGGVPAHSWGVTIHPTEPIVAMGGRGGVFKVWNAETGEQLYEIGHSEGGLINQAAFSPDGMLIAVSGSLAPVRIYDAKTGEKLSTLSDVPGGHLVFSAENTLISGSHVEGKLREFTVSLDDALALARERVTREMTQQECLQYMRNADSGVSFGNDE